MTIDFSRGAWDTDARFNYTFSYRFEETPVFIQNDDCVENAKNPAAPCVGYDYVSVMAMKPYSTGVTAVTRCAFSGTGAPLFIIATDLDLCADGKYRYGDYFEVVLYKNGVNVWRLKQNDAGQVVVTAVAEFVFPVSTDDIHVFSIRLEEQRTIIRVDDTTLCADTLVPGEIFGKFYLGLSACEGPCKFYSLDIQ